MRIQKKSSGIVEGDLTPMIDMTFQLIAFFMVLINFTQAEQDQRVKLPASTLAKPPEETKDQPLTIQLARTDDGTYLALVGGDEIPIGEALEGILMRERRAFGRQSRSAAEVIVIVRAHKDAPTGQVQEVVEICQKTGFERFRLRVKEKI